MAQDVADSMASAIFDEIVDNLKWLRCGDWADQEDLDDRLNDLIAEDVGCDFKKLIKLLTDEIQKNIVVETAISDFEDTSNFILELGGFLRDMSCPHSALFTGDLSQRLDSDLKRLKLLAYLTSELQSLRILALTRPEMLSATQPADIASAVEAKNRAECSAELADAMRALQIPKPPAGITEKQACGRLITDLKKFVSSGNSTSVLGEALLRHSLTGDQWRRVEKFVKIINEDFKLRRAMLRTRCDVTIQSFTWGPRGKAKAAEIANRYSETRKSMSATAEIGVSHIMAARTHAMFIQTVNNPQLRAITQSAINKASMGWVPDRGGRTHEMQPPPPEMPQFKKRENDGGGRGRGGGHRGGRMDGVGMSDRSYSANSGFGGGSGFHGGGGRGGGGGGWSDRPYTPNHGGYNRGGGGGGRGRGNYRGGRY